MIDSIISLEEVNIAIENNDAILLYFSNDSCSVCKVLKPKVKTLLNEEFPLCKMIFIDTDKSPEVHGQLSVFSIPTIIIYFEGKEYARRSRNFGILELRDILSRPYSLLFSE